LWVPNATSSKPLFRLAGLTLAGLAYGLVYALTGNLWLVTLLHATMNYRPLLLSVDVPADLHLVVGVVEYAAAAHPPAFRPYLQQ
jgi:membrane protease YdiL (CAAX protease family)